VKGFWAYLVPFSFIMCLSALYEIFEWLTVIQYGGSVGYQFIGGNDPFDTAKDLASEGVGSILGLLIVAIVERFELEEKFWHNIKKSFVRDARTAPKEDKLLHEPRKVWKKA
jgi:hypothetical protein